MVLLVPILQGCDCGARSERITVCCGPIRRTIDRWRCRRHGTETADAPATPAKAENPWISLFDGKTLDQWEAPTFGGEGAVTVEDGSMILDFGNAATGVKFKGEFPKTDYEIRLEAMRVDGFDFFCGLTFPVGESCATFIVGGWSGGVVGISCIDGFDASENETTKYRTFETGQWYKIRLVVTDEKIQAWIDGEPFADVTITDRQIDTRPEVDLCRPLGVTSWNTKAALRNIRYRRLPNEGT